MTMIINYLVSVSAGILNYVISTAIYHSKALMAKTILENVPLSLVSSPQMATYVPNRQNPLYIGVDTKRVKFILASKSVLKRQSRVIMAKCITVTFCCAMFYRLWSDLYIWSNCVKNIDFNFSLIKHLRWCNFFADDRMICKKQYLVQRLISVWSLYVGLGSLLLTWNPSMDK